MTILKRWWWLLNGRCELCGGMISPSFYTTKTYCAPCSKALIYGKQNGAGPEFEARLRRGFRQ